MYVRGFSVPNGFTPLDSQSPFNLHVGPLYTMERDGQLVVGLRVREHHCNTAGRLHGGMVATLADVAFGHNIGRALAEGASGSGAPVATVSMSTDFAGSARLGDWLETDTDVQRVGGSLAFANLYVTSNSARIARASAVFRVFR